MNTRRLMAALMLWAMLAGAAQAEEAIVQIGKVDHNFSDLGPAQPVQAYAKSFPNDVKFVVGQSDAKKDFSGIHPGPEDAWAGRRQHPFAIEFTLADEPAGTYELKIDLVDTHANAAPTLRVDVNGSSVEQTLARGAGDISLVRPQAGKQRTLRFILGPKYLKKGSNRIELTVTHGSWLLYDAISLARLSDGKEPAIELKATPTIFFVERDGRLLQELRLSASGVAKDEPAKITVHAGVDKVGEAKLDDSRLGTASGSVYVEEAVAPRQLTVTVSTAGQSKTVSLTQVPQKKWHIFVSPSVHTDIGYTNLQSQVIAVHDRNTDLALEMVREFPLYHWNLESSWAAQMWFRDVPEYRHEELLQAAREHRIGIESGYLNMLTGLCSEEELIRNLYYSARLHRLYGVPFESCTITDAPSHVWSVPSILAGAGIHCLSVGVNQTRAPLFKKEIHKKSPFWWEGPDGAKVLTWFAAGYAQAGQIGLNDGFEQMRSAVERDLTWWGKRTDYPYDAILLHGAYSDNNSSTKHIAETITEYARHYAYPKVVLCANNDFFAYIEKNFADKIPTVRGGGGSWWEDGAGSTAVETAINRTAHADAVAAETIWGVLKAQDKAKAVPQGKFDKVWDNILLFDEHTWGAFNSITQPLLDFVARQWAVKAAYATTAKDGADRLIEHGLTELAAQVDVPAGSLLVFNPSGQKRSGLVEAAIPRDMVIADHNGPLPQQVTRSALLVKVGVLFEARDVPAVGYRTYKLVPALQEGRAVSPVAPKRFDGKVLENDYYKVSFDPKTGGVASLFDKTLGKELVDAGSPYKLGQLIYAAGGTDKPNEMRWDLPDPNKIKFSSPEKSRQELGSAGSVFTSVKSQFPMPMFPHAEMVVVLYEHERRVDVNFRLRKDHTFNKEAVYFAFPFAGTGPQFRYEIGGGNVRPNEDQFPGACRDWFSVQRWVTVNTKQQAVAFSPIDTPLVTFCQMTPGNWLDELPITNGTIFAYVMNNYWATNYKAAQDGDFTFRYSITSDKAIDPAAATAFGAAVQEPMRAVVTVPGAAGGQGKLPASASFCSVQPASVEVTTVKPADDGRGVIVRLHETAGQATDATVALSLPNVQKVSQWGLVERDQ